MELYNPICNEIKKNEPINGVVVPFLRNINNYI